MGSEGIDERSVISTPQEMLRQARKAEEVHVPATQQLADIGCHVLQHDREVCCIDDD